MCSVALQFTELVVIKSWKHKELQRFYQLGRADGINPKHAHRLTLTLQMLDAATKPEDMNLPGMRFHKLKGEFKYYYSVTVSGNWKVIFQFEGKDAVLVNYLDYH